MDPELEQRLEAQTRRLDRLEREARRWRRACKGALALCGVLLFTGQSGDPRTVEAERFVIRDASGAVRGELGVNGRDARLLLANGEGNARMLLTLAAFCAGAFAD